METTRIGNCVRFVAAVRVGMLALAWVHTPATAQEAPTPSIREFIPSMWMAADEVLLRMEPVRQELKLSEEQIAKQSSIIEGRGERLQRARRENQEVEKFRAARDAIFKEVDAAIQANLASEQRTWLEQVRLQAQGPLAFARPAEGPLADTALPLLDRLKVSDDQVARIKAIFNEELPRIAKAASFPIALDTKNGPPTIEAIGKLVDSPEFQAAKLKARRDGRDASAAVVARIEEVLTDEQRNAYHAQLGAPFDLSKLRSESADGRQGDVQRVARALGLNGGQRADPTFDSKVARPAYARAARRPRVLFDEAHRNFHTAGGRYKPFAELITNDGCEVVSNSESFSATVLQKGDILVIANAMGSAPAGGPGAPAGAITDAECDAVRDWVKDGGSLLLIADHPPFSAAAAVLAQRFDVTIGRGVASDPAHSKGGETYLVFTRQDHLLGEHPITQGRDASERLERVQTFTGTSLKGPEGSVAILKLSDTAVDRALGDAPAASVERGARP